MTCMHITKECIIIALDNGTVHVLDHDGGNKRRVKVCEKGIWALCAWEEEYFVVGGVDAVVGVWDLGTL